MISTKRYQTRQLQLHRWVKKQTVQAFLINSEVNVKYLTGFTGDSSVLIVTQDRAIMVSDGRFTTQLEQECPGLEVNLRKVTETLAQAISQVLKKLNVASCGVESDSLSLATYELISGAIPQIDLVSHSGVIEQFRQIKDREEIQEIRQAVQLAERGYQYLKSGLTLDMSEREAANYLEEGMRRFGAVGCSFETIVATGPHAALPHARPRENQLGEAPFFLLDWGALGPSGYCSDLTRMMVTGSISTKLLKRYEVVKNAQQEAIRAIRPGIEVREIDRIARSIIQDAGLGKYFTHSLGHGIGMQVHENVRLGPSSEDKLQPGMVVTIEPGVYFAGWGGIRLEDDILVTPDGHEVLSSLSRDLEHLVI